MGGTFLLLSLGPRIPYAIIHGKGAKVATSLLETGVTWTTLLMTNYQATGEVPGPAGSTSPAAAPYRGFRHQRPIWILIAAGNDRLFAKLWNVLGCSALASDPRFVSNPERVARRMNFTPCWSAKLGATVPAN